MSRNEITGYVTAIIASMSFGLNPLFGKFLYREGMNALDLIFYRFAIGTVLLALLMVVRHSSFHLSKKMFLSVFAGGFLLAFCCLTWFESFAVMDSGVGAAIMFVYPVMVAIIMAVFFGEKVTKSIVFAIILATAGVTLLCIPAGNSTITVKGVLLVLISSLAYAFYMVEVKVTRLRFMHPEKLTFYAMLSGTFIIFAFLRFGLALHGIPRTVTAYANVFGLAFFPSFLAFLLTTVAIGRIGATKAAIFGALEPLTAIFTGVVVFSEGISITMISGVILVLSSVTAVIAGGHYCKNEREKEQTREEPS